MNRNYLPPSLKQSQVSGSPPSNSYVMPQQRRYGRACKLPTVQEVMGKRSYLRRFLRNLLIPHQLDLRLRFVTNNAFDVCCRSRF